MGVWTNVWGPTVTSDDDGNGGYPYYYIPSDIDILVESYQQYTVHDREYLDVAGSIEVETDGEVLIIGD